VSTGGRQQKQLTQEELTLRFDYFRETWAYGSTRLLDRPVLDKFMHNPALIEAARQVYGHPHAVVEPHIVYRSFFV